VNALTNLEVPQNARNFFDWLCVIFLRVSLLYGVKFLFIITTELADVQQVKCVS
jgi:hypothetical protein